MYAYINAYIHTYIMLSIFPADRLRNFDVLLNNLNFDAAKNNRGNKLCMYQRGALGLGETKTLRCKKQIKARFVKFRIRGTGVLTLCEVEVYARKGEGKYAYVIIYKYIIS